MSQITLAKNIVLVHGAFADGSSWSKVIPLLQAKGYKVTSVAISLTSFKDDVAVTKRALAAQDGPMILVGHSYGGVVITKPETTLRSSASFMLPRSLRCGPIHRGRQQGFS